MRNFGDNFAKNLRTFCEKITEIGISSWENGAGNVAIIFSECDVILLIASLRCTRNLFYCAPSQLVLSFYASGPTGGLPTAFGCLRCHSFYLSVTHSSMAVCVHFYCYQWCIAFHSHLLRHSSTSGPISWWYSCIRTHHRIA